ncbi:MAG: hypothetical protein JSV65_15525 [Armatimonadota bacterium]|nr:MAG: hypothetical protein JSV65_15525 [Armatimonadota bacterium]
MGRWFVLLVIIAGFTGAYWTVMSGWAAEKAVAVDIRGAARENDPQAILDRLEKAESRLDSQKQWVKRFDFIARDPDWSRVEDSRKILHELQAATSEVIAVSGGEIGAEGTERLRKYLKGMQPLPAGVFREGQDTLWKVLFWISAVGIIILGLLMFVRRIGD